MLAQLTGHEVIGSSRSQERGEGLRTVGAEPLVLDTLDARAAREAVAAVRPDAIVYQATALSDLSDFKHFDRSHELARAAEEAVAYEPPDQPAIT